MAALISVELLKKQVRVTHTYEDSELQLYCDQATAIVLEAIKGKDSGLVPVVTPITPPTWDETTVPSTVQSMILAVGAHLYTHRGDEEPSDPLAPIQSRLEFWRHPTLA
jgi:hypothetical protein